MTKFGREGHSFSREVASSSIEDQLENLLAMRELPTTPGWYTLWDDGTFQAGIGRPRHGRTEHILLHDLLQRAFAFDEYSVEYMAAEGLDKIRLYRDHGLSRPECGGAYMLELGQIITSIRLKKVADLGLRQSLNAEIATEAKYGSKAARRGQDERRRAAVRALVDQGYKVEAAVVEVAGAENPKVHPRTVWRAWSPSRARSP